jgi:hypothetical protein
MTPQEAIAELEKPRKGYPQRVLTWEQGDAAVCDGEIWSVRKVGILDLTLEDGWDTIVRPAKDCTHSADDPRLLGRVLRELDGGPFKSVSIDYAGKYNYVRLFRHPWEEGNSISTEGGTLLEAALLAWLAKVEGEQDVR